MKAPSSSGERRVRLIVSWISGRRCDKPASAEPAAMGEELGLALEMRTGPERSHCLLRGLRGSHLVQLGEVAGESDQRRLGFGAGGSETLQLAQHRGRIAAARGVDERLERGLSRVTDNRLDVVMGDFGSALRIERELDHLRAGERLVGAEPRHQIAPRLAIDAKAGLGELDVDERGETALVAIAGKRRRLPVFLEQFAQGRIGTKIAGLDDERVVERRGEQSLQARHVESRSGRDPDHLARGEHRPRAKLDLEPRGILGEIAIVETNDLGIALYAAREHRGKCARALGDQACVGTVKQHSPARRLGRPEETRDG